MKTTTTHYDAPLNTSVMSIKECLKMIGIKEVTANVFTVPAKKSK